jgi:hypothetical protein
MRAAPLLLVAMAIASATSRAAADEPREEHAALLDRPHTIAELEVGILALPTAPISPSSRGGSTPLGAIGSGDATVETGVHIFYRPDREWSFGAGALFAPHPTSDSDYGGASGLPRTHSRSYLLLGAEGRYFPLHTRWFEAWFGLDAGGVIISDRFATDSAPPVPSLLGTNTVTVSTEGFSLGVQIGGDYLISDSFVLGLTLRADRWFLPSEKPFSQQTSCDPIGDCPTLTGNVAAFSGALTFGYRLPL